MADAVANCADAAKRLTVAFREFANALARLAEHIYPFIRHMEYRRRLGVLRRLERRAAGLRRLWLRFRISELEAVLAGKLLPFDETLSWS